MTNTTRIVIKGIHPYDGEYELDTNRAFNAREWHWIKSVSGYMPLTVGEGFAGGDPELYVALAVIAMERNRRIGRDDWQQVAAELAEAPFDGSTILLVGATGDGDDEIPPALTSEPAGSLPTSSLENNDSSRTRPRSSGEPSQSSSGLSDVTLPVTGTGESGMSVPQLVRTGSGN